MNRIEAVIFASTKPVDREALNHVVGRGANIDLLIADIQADLKSKPYEIVSVAGGWMFRTRSQYATAIKTAADLGEQQHNFFEEEMAVLCAVAYHQPIDRAGLAAILGKEINRDLLGRLRYKNLIDNGPKSPRPGAPHTFLTTAEFLAMFDLLSLRDLPELDLSFGEPDTRRPNFCEYKSLTLSIDRDSFLKVLYQLVVDLTPMNMPIT